MIDPEQLIQYFDEFITSPSATLGRKVERVKVGDVVKYVFSWEDDEIGSITIKPFGGIAVTVSDGIAGLGIEVHQSRWEVIDSFIEQNGGKFTLVWTWIKKYMDMVYGLRFIPEPTLEAPQNAHTIRSIEVGPLVLDSDGVSTPEAKALKKRDVPTTSNPNVEAGINPDLYQRLSKTLLRCGPFDSDNKLRAIFANELIIPWHSKLPEANSPDERVTNTIDFLYKQKRDTGENALVLFLRVLSDSKVQGDACKQELGDLADMLERELQQILVS